MVLIPPDVDVTSVVVSFKSLVVGGGVVVETPGVVALNPFVFWLERSGAAKEEERGRRSRASFIILQFFLALLLFQAMEVYCFCASTVWDIYYIQLRRQDPSEEWRIK